MSRRGPTHPRATMQKFEKKGVAGGASCKSLKTKRQICSFCCKEPALNGCTRRAVVKEARQVCIIRSDGRKTLPLKIQNQHITRNLSR
jgi:hypothetical protein